MALKLVLDKVDDLPADVKKEYVQKDGKFVLQFEGEPVGFVTKASHDEQLAKLAEFRDNNRGLNGKVTDLETKLKTFEGVDPAEFKTLKERLKNVGADNGDVQAAIQKRVQEQLEPLVKEVSSLRETNKQDKINLATEAFKNGFKDIALKAGVDETMLPIFIDHALKTFQLVDGKFVPRVGDVPVYSKKSPAEVIGLTEWTALQATEFPNFFKQSSGGGAGNKGSGDGSRRNSEGKTVISNDPLEFGKNLEKIAKGEVVLG